MRSVASVCVSVYLSCSSSNFQKPWPRKFILVHVYVFRISRSSSYINIKGHRFTVNITETKYRVSVCKLTIRLKLLNVSIRKLYFQYASASLWHLGEGRVSKSRGQGQSHTIVTTYINTHTWVVCLSVKDSILAAVSPAYDRTIQNKG